MRSYSADFELVSAKDMESAFVWLSRGHKPLAGGTDVMVLFNAGKLKATKLVAIGRLPELRSIVVSTDFIEIGAAVNYSELRQHAFLSRDFPLLAQAASWTGGVANQNRGTLGGNIANASPAADSAPVLLAYEAELTLISASGVRTIPYADFHLGYKATALKPDELIASIRLPRLRHLEKQYGRKVGTRKAMAISKVSLAATASASAFRIAVGSVAPMPMRCLKTEDFLASQKLTPASVGEARKILTEEISPISDLRSTSNYRAAVTGNLLGEFMEMLL